MYADTSFATLYNPGEFTPEQLIDRFVVRLKVFERMYKEISTSSMKTPEQHYLIHGRRGMGKTTLLLRLAYEIEKDPKLNAWMLPVVYNEEEHSINRLSRFWERAAEILADKHSKYASLPDEMDALHSGPGGRENEFEEAIFNLMIERVQANGHKIVLFVDNFGTLFRRFNDRENKRLRTVLQTCPDLRIIGATPIVLGEVYDVKHPFYEFFKIERLSGLDKDETRDLLLKIGETTGKLEEIQDILTHQPGRVETLRRFTSGVIRTMVLLFDVFTDDHNGGAFHDLEIIIDLTTPLYQHRMDDLSSQQKPIVEAIALGWDAVSTKEIVARTRMESKVVSAQLSQLSENEIIERIPTHTKNHLYQLNERFFNIWYLMRFGRRDTRRKVKWLIRFIESWCDPAAFTERAQSHIAAMRAGTYHIEGAYLMSEALAGTKYSTRKLQHELLLTTADFLKDRDPKLAKNLSKSDQELIDEACAAAEKGEMDKAVTMLKKMVVPDYYALGYRCFEAGNYEKAIGFLLKDGSAKGFFIIGFICYKYLNDFTKAEKYFLLAIDKGDVKGINSLAYHYLKRKTNPKDALSLVKRLTDQQEIPPFHAHTAACVFLWNNQVPQALALREKFCFDDDLLEDTFGGYTRFLLLLLAKEQYEFLYELFSSERGVEKQLKDRFKPIWYALMHYMREQYPAEYLRMGEELKETVEEIIRKVESMRIEVLDDPNVP